MLARSSVASVHVAAGARFKASRDAVHVLDLNGISAPDSGLPRLASPGLLQDDLVRAFVELVRLEGIPARVLVWPTVRNSPDSVAETSTAIAREIKRLYGIDVAVSDGSVRDSALEPMSLDAQKRSKFESLYV
nr:hypothetical protein HK105_006628 [Polyrhizophydium stewartii]